MLTPDNTSKMIEIRTYFTIIYDDAYSKTYGNKLRMVVHSN